MSTFVYFCHVIGTAFIKLRFYLSPFQFFSNPIGSPEDPILLRDKLIICYQNYLAGCDNDNCLELFPHKHIKRSIIIICCIVVFGTYVEFEHTSILPL